MNIMLISLAAVAAVAVLVVLTFFIMVTWRRVVSTNEVHIVQFSKKSVEYGTGFPAGNTYYEVPTWIPVFGVTVSKFPVSVFDISLKDYEAYDVGRLPFLVDIRAFFRIAHTQKAAERVKNIPELHGQLQGVLQGAVRRILATNTLENILQDRSTLGEQFTKEVNEQLLEWGVLNVKTIEFMDIRDVGNSKVIENMMAKEKSRIEMESRVAVAENTKITQSAEIDAQRIVELNKTQAAQEVAIRKAESDKVAGIAREQSNQAIQTEAKTTKALEMEVIQVESVKNAEIEKEVSIINAKKNQEVQTVLAETDKKVSITKASANKESMVLNADGKLQETIKNSEGISAEGKAKAEAQQAFLMAPVNAQLTLAEKIGSNEQYQKYLIQVEQIKANQAVGEKQAEALKTADLKIIANGGDVQSGINNLGEILSPKGGTALAGAISAFTQTSEGKAILDTVLKTTPKEKK